MRNYGQIIQVLFFATAFFYSGVSPAKEGPTMHDRIYHFQHRMLPNWTFESDGKFYRDLLNGNFDILFNTASNVVGEEFSKNITIQRLDDIIGVLLIFPKPTEPPKCYFVFITKINEDYRFITYEKTHDLSGIGDKGVVGEWLADGTHLNLGSRKYEDAEEFINDIKELK